MFLYNLLFKLGWLTTKAWNVHEFEFQTDCHLQFPCSHYVPCVENKFCDSLLAYGNQVDREDVTKRESSLL